jgi:hypothetical protein
MRCDEPSKETVTICDQYFKLKVYGKWVCPKAFGKIYCICENTLRSIVKSLDDQLSSDNEGTEDEGRVDFDVRVSKKQRARKFLEYMAEKYGEPVMGSENTLSLTYFYDKVKVWKFFNHGKIDGLQGEFEGIIAENWNNPISQNYFLTIWRKYFPHLITESEKPQCSECLTAQEEMALSKKNKDNKHIMIKQKIEKHLQRANAIFQLSMDCLYKSKAFPNYCSFVVDNMASKVIPKRRRESLDTWSKDKLILHLGGVYDDSTDCASYFLYPEMLSEDVNTILTQCHLTLLRRVQAQQELFEVVFIFDNHSTQKNYVLLSYFEYLVRSGVLPPGGSISLIFLVRGHTHNRLDQRNSEVSKKYFGALEINSLVDMVNIINRIGPNHRGELLSTVWDFKGWLEPHIDQTVTQQFMLSLCHQIKITQEGIVTKKFNEYSFSEWRGTSPSWGRSMEPSHLLKTLPTDHPAILQIPTLSADKFRRLSSVFGSSDKLLAVIDVFIRQHPRQFQMLPHFTPESDGGLPTIEPSTSSTADASSSSPQPENQEEEVVYDIVKRRKIRGKDEYRWQVRWRDKNGELTWEPKEAFLDSDGRMTEMWHDFEKNHPLTRKRKRD